MASSCWDSGPLKAKLKRYLRRNKRKRAGAHTPTPPPPPPPWRAPAKRGSERGGGNAKRSKKEIRSLIHGDDACAQTRAPVQLHAASKLMHMAKKESGEPARGAGPCDLGNNQMGGTLVKTGMARGDVIKEASNQEGARTGGHLEDRRTPGGSNGGNHTAH